MRLSLSLAALALLTGPALAAPSKDWSAAIAAQGLARTEVEIAALNAPSPEDLFVLGAVRFLGGIESVLQARWAVGQSEEVTFLPVFRLPLAANPHPAPFDPALVETTFTGLLDRMADTRSALVQVPPAVDLAVPVNLGDLWFDVNASGGRDPGEAVLEIADFLLDSGPRFDPETGEMLPQRPPVANLAVTFDTADAAWLSAYSHLLSGTAEIVLAFRPSEAISRVMAGRKAMVAAGVPSPLDTMLYGHDGPAASGYPNDIDAVAMTLLTLRQAPEARRTRAARDHLLAMSAESRRFWAEVGAETDDHQEWIPNARQQAALGAAFPQGVDVAWQAVLDDGEKLLRGEVLAPYLVDGIGFDLGKWLETPSPVDLIEWLHGMGIQPYLRRGPVVSAENWAVFEQTTMGNALLFAVWLN